MKKTSLFLFLTLVVPIVAKNKSDKKLVVLDQVSAIVYQGDSPDLGSKDEDLSQNQHVVITQIGRAHV